MATYHIFYNPSSGNGLGKEKAEVLKTLLSTHTLIFYDLLEIKDLQEKVSAIPVEENILLAGGNGTLNYFINHVNFKEIENNIFHHAMGSGNDFYRDLGFESEDHIVRINQYLENLPKVTARGDDYYFLNGVGLGLDGYCCETGNEMSEISGKPVNYALIGIKGILFDYKPTSARVIVDGRVYNYDRVWFIVTMYGKYIGGGMMATPFQDRNASDQKVTVMVMKDIGKLKLLLNYPKIFRGTHVDLKELVEFFTGNDITVDFDCASPLQLDGETIKNVCCYHVVSNPEPEKNDETK